MKRGGSLTRGRDMTESQQTIWTFAMPASVIVNERMRNLTCLAELTIENLTEDISLISSRRARNLDIEKIVQYIEPLESFR